MAEQSSRVWGQGLGTGPHLQQHVPRLDAPVRGHRPSFHDGADVDATIAPVIALAHDADSQEVVLFYMEGGEGEKIKADKVIGMIAKSEAASALKDLNTSAGQGLTCNELRLL